MIKPRIWFLSSLAILAAASHALPHPPNFAPMAAVALFGAATFPGRWSAFLVPIAALLLGDLILQLTYMAGWQEHWGFYNGQWVVYACLLPSILLGFLIRERRTVATVAAAVLGSSLFFFAATNFAVWAYGVGVTYPKNAAGLLLCYTEALPFLKNSLAGDVFYSVALFGTLALAEATFPTLRSRKPQPIPELVTSERS
jgi:hypothetical protein